MAWEFAGGQPIYQQIIRSMEIQIVSGKYNPGEKIPAVRELAAQAGVNPNTMQRALTELEREGLLYSRRTSGRFVTENESTIREARRTLAEQFISEMFKNLENLGMKRGEIIEAIDHWKE